MCAVTDTRTARFALPTRTWRTTASDTALRIAQTHKMSRDDSVFLALGMVTAPESAARRDLVRKTMLASSRAVQEGSVVFRFLVGCGPGSGCKGPLNVHRKDMLALSALDGPAVSEHGPHCACIEKMGEWFKYALRQWPSAQYYGKTEEDAYVHIDGIVHELIKLGQKHTNLAFSKWGTCSMPPEPRRNEHTPPPRGTDYRIWTRARSKVERIGFQGCWLGATETFRPPRDGREAMGKWVKSLEQCGGADSAPAPFPLGPLVVLQRDLATSLFQECAYVRRFLRLGRQVNRATSCSARQAGQVRLARSSFSPLLTCQMYSLLSVPTALGACNARSRCPQGASASFATATCDCVLGHWMAQCNLNATLADVTWTRFH